MKSKNNLSIPVFDIGGTWFRRGVWKPNHQLEFISRRPSINYMNTPCTDVRQLQHGLVEYLVEEVKQCQRFTGEKAHLVGVSLGAAMNCHSGEVFDSGPIWGPNGKSFFLQKILEKHLPGIKWVIVNDVSAALYRYVVAAPYVNAAKTSLFTISTGIACRTYDSRTGNIVVDRQYGLQGEIGHIPINFFYNNKPYCLRCDCGGANHLNAFCSGRGIESLLQLLTGCAPETFKSSLMYEYTNGGLTNLSIEVLGRAVKHSDMFALSILDSVTAPIAMQIINLLTLDPEVERIILTGGIVHNFDPQYLESLFNNLERTGMYQITCRSPSFFRDRIELGTPDDHSGLIGAGIFAQKFLI